MSVFRSLSIPCAGCGHVQVHAAAESLNAGTRTEMRQQILDDTFQRFACERCDRRVLVDGPMLLFHYDRHHWLELYPLPWERAWRALEQQTVRRFEQTVIDLAPPLMQVQAEDFIVRTVFGLYSLRDKLVCLDAGIDDRALEALKLDLLRTDPDLLGDPDVRLRLRAVKPAALTFSVHSGAKVAGEMTVARSHLDAIAGTAWEPTREAVSGGPYIDVGRVLIPGTDPQPR